MKIIAITGKSGSGKTFVSNAIASASNAKVLSFDKFSHAALQTDSLKQFALENFGNSVFDENGEINRKKLGQIAFANQSLLKQWNALAEQKMIESIDQELKNSQNETIIIEYALLPQMKYFQMADLKILIEANFETRKNRIISRDSISEEYFLLRENNSLEYNKDEYDFVVTNDTITSNLTEIIEKIK